jgi:hypothetical protein
VSRKRLKKLKTSRSAKATKKEAKQFLGNHQFTARIHGQRRMKSISSSSSEHQTLITAATAIDLAMFSI